MNIDTAPGVGQGIHADATTPFGFLALELAQRLNERWSIRFSAHGIAESVDEDETAYIDFDVAGAYRVISRKTRLYLGLAAFTGFIVMFTLAMRNTRRPEIHKRMILLAMLTVLPPGVNRFWYKSLGTDNRRSSAEYEINRTGNHDSYTTDGDASSYRRRMSACAIMLQLIAS